jgi:hypothetical protein
MAGVVPAKTHVGFAGFAVRYNRKALEAELLAALEVEHARRVARGDIFLSDAERSAQLEKLDADLYTLGVQEELAVLRLESADRPVIRRGEADPRAVLATVLS